MTRPPVVFVTPPTTSSFAPEVVVPAAIEIRGSPCYTGIVEKEIHLTTHARLSLTKRGATAEEVRQAITNEGWTHAKHGRLEASKVFPYNGVWNGKTYRWKQVVPIFVEEPDQIVVITVYAFYF